jgi:hypothetical protein
MKMIFQVTAKKTSNVALCENQSLSRKKNHFLKFSLSPQRQRGNTKTEPPVVEQIKKASSISIDCGATSSVVSFRSTQVKFSEFFFNLTFLMFESMPSKLLLLKIFIDVMFLLLLF